MKQSIARKGSMRPVRQAGIPAYPASSSPGYAASHDLLSSLDSFVPSASPSLVVQDDSGACRPAEAAEVLRAAQYLLANRVRGSQVFTSQDEVKDFLRMRLGLLPHEIFAILHLDARHAVIDFEELFRGTLTQVSVHSREVVKGVLARNSAAVMLVHCHPSGDAEPSPSDRALTYQLRAALAAIDVIVLDHYIVTHHEVLSMAELGSLPV